MKKKPRIEIDYDEISVFAYGELLRNPGNLRAWLQEWAGVSAIDAALLSERDLKNALAELQKWKNNLD